ncbi:hypothetical protein ACQ4LE_002389 [Meloidogyne hapla]
MTRSTFLIFVFFLFNSPLISSQYLQPQNWQNPTVGYSSPFDRCCFCCCFCPVPSTQAQWQQSQLPGDKFPPSQGYGQSQQMPPMQQNKYPPSIQSSKIPGGPTAGYWSSLSETSPYHSQQKQSAESNDFWQNFQGMDHPNQNKETRNMEETLSGQGDETILKKTSQIDETIKKK